MEHVAVTRASTAAIGDGLKCSGYTLDITTSLIVVRESKTKCLKEESRGHQHIF